MFLAGLMLISNNAYALYYFDSYGIVDQNYENSYDSNTGSGIARYSFGFDDPMVNVSEVSLEFESNIFDISNLVITPVLPVGWTSSIQSGGSVTFVIDGGAAISSSQDPIVFDVAYTLNDVNAYYQTSGDFGRWSEGQAWGQSYTLVGYRSPTTRVVGAPEVAISGGSTNPVPEPMTMLLFGPALLGLVGLKKRKA